MLSEDPQHLEADGILVSLTNSELDIASTIASVKSHKAGAIVLFAGINSTHQFPTLSTK